MYRRLPRLLARFAVLLTLGALLMGGCAYQTAVNRGDQYAESKQWRAAYEAYKRARRIKPEAEEIDQKLEHARQHALKHRFGEARQAIEAGEWKQAQEDLEECEELAHTEADDQKIARLRADIESGLIAEIDAALKGERYRRAYKRADRASELLGATEAVAQRRTDLKHHFFDRSDRLADDGAWQKALAALEPIEKWGDPPPEVQDAIDARRRKIHDRWAATARSDAKTYKSDGHLGAAMMRYLRAWEVAERESDRRRAADIAGALKKRGAARLQLRYGASARGRHAASAWKAIRQRLSGRDDVRLTGSPTRVDATLAVQRVRSRCEEEVVGSETDSKRYLASTNEVPNPEWKELRRKKRDVCRQIDPTYHDLEDAEDHVDKHREEFEHFKHDVVPQVQRKVRALEDRLDDARREAEREQEREEERQRQQYQQQQQRQHAHHDDHDGHSDHGDHDGHDGDENHDREVERLERKLERAREDLDEVQDRKEEEHDKMHDAIDEKEAIAHELGDLERRCQNLEDEMDATSRTVVEENWATYRYRVDVHERVCDFELTYRFDGMDVDTRRRASSGHTSQDKSHPDHPGYDIAEDPLDFPDSRTTLLDRASVDVVDAIDGWVVDRVGEHFRREARSALQTAADDPHAATDRLLALELAGGRHLSAEIRSRIDAHLQEHYGTAGLGPVVE